MDVAGGQSLYPLHRCKTIHLVRHAQGIHNVEGEKDHSAYLSPHLFDAHLTPLGWQQVDHLREHVHASGIFKKVELVITSPLLRCMQTAVGVFGGEDYTDGMDGVHWCDKRRSISEYRPLFPAIDFSLVESDDDVLWKPDIRELNKEVASRGIEFLKWLWTRKEKEIAIVTHSGFLTHTLGVFGSDCHPDVQREIRRRFQNCELRSMVITDRSMIGFDSSTTDYPGKIPSGEDMPSDDTCIDQPNELPN
ncbi:unnamed protein product [Withania somnifera]